MVFEDIVDEDAAIRRRWGKNLGEVMEIAGVSRKQLVVALAEQGVDVTHQAVAQWLSGQTAPRPHAMLLIASIVRVPPRVLFALDSTIVKRAA